MTIEQQTLKRLQHLQELYRRGYQSDVVDLSIDKIIALERTAAERELTDLQGRLKVFEGRYGMPSAEFYERFRAGELGDAADFVEWSVFYEMRESVRERLEMLTAEAA